MRLSVGTDVKSVVEISHALGAATDELNAALARAEAAFSALNLGVAASVNLDQDRESDWSTDLTFRKSNGHWRLLVESGHIGDDEWTVTPLTNASRETRLLAASRLGDLHQKMLEVAENQLEEVRTTTAAVQSFIASLEKKGKR